jgi:hypothetical protein
METYDFYVVLVNMFYSLQEIDEDYINICLNILTIMICYFVK